MSAAPKTHPSKLIACKDCGNNFHGHYCNNCGQEAHTGNIDKHFLYHEIQHGLFHIDGGILYTIKELVTRPGVTIRLFIQGKRVKHFKPLAFLLVMAGIYTFLNHYVNAAITAPVQVKDKNANNAISEFTEFIKTHYAIYELLQLPILSWVCFLLFNRYGTNYFEELVINAYLGGQRILLFIVLLPLSYLLLRTNHTMLDFCFHLAIPVLLFAWAFPQYYHAKPRFSIIWRAVLACVINFVLIQVVASIVLTLLAGLSSV